MENVTIGDIYEIFNSSVVISQHIVNIRTLKDSVTINNQTNLCNRRIWQKLVLHSHGVATSNRGDLRNCQFFDYRIGKTNIVKNLSQFYLIVTSSSTRGNDKCNLTSRNSVVSLRDQQFTVDCNCKVLSRHWGHRSAQEFKIKGSTSSIKELPGRFKCLSLLIELFQGDARCQNGIRTTNSLFVVDNLIIDHH